MKWEVVTVHDRAADCYATPQCFKHKGEAMRAFQDAINNPESRTMYAHPDDYDLFYLGTWDDHTGDFEDCEPYQLAIGKQLKIRT